MRWTEKDMCKHFGHLEDHQYRHFNNALGVKVESKEHFRSLLENGNYIPYEESCKQVERNVDNQKYVGLNENKKKFCHNLKDKVDKNGKLQWTDGLVKGLKEEAGLDYSYYTKLPKHWETDLDTNKGGF